MINYNCYINYNRDRFFFRYYKIKSISRLNKNKEPFSNKKNFKIETFISIEEKRLFIVFIKVKENIQNNAINLEITLNNTIII